jgi:hypothetical protein
LDPVTGSCGPLGLVLGGDDVGTVDDDELDDVDEDEVEEVDDVDEDEVVLVGTVVVVDGMQTQVVGGTQHVVGGTQQVGTHCCPQSGGAPQ